MLIDLLLKICKKKRDQVALVSKNNIHYSWSDYAMTVIEIASSLHKLGLNKGDTICLNCYNCPKWFFIAMGCIYGNNVFIPVYEKERADVIEEIIEENNCKMIFSNNENLLFKLKNDNIIKICLKKLGKTNNIIYWNDFINKSNEDYIEPTNSEDQSSLMIVYSSGTNGDKKKVEIREDQIFNKLNLLKSNYGLFQESYISFLPLENIVIILLDFYQHLFTESTVYFSDIKCLSNPKDFLEKIKEVNPTTLYCVPFVWYKLMKIFDQDIKKYESYIFIGIIILSIKYLNRQILEYNGKNKILLVFLIIAHWFTRIIFKLYKKIYGLSRCHLYLNLLGKLNNKIITYFGEIDIPILQIYGCTESLGIDCLSNKYYSVGVGFPVSKIILSTSNEVQIMNNLIDHKFLNENGYFKTGDYGRFLDDGRLEYLSLNDPTATDYSFLENCFLKKLIHIEDIYCKLVNNKLYVIIILYELDDNISIDDIINDYHNGLANSEKKIDWYKILISDQIYPYRNNLLKIIKHKLLTNYIN